jgi:outer membrane protein OmpA-like peptidoglycan-associated protein
MLQTKQINAELDNAKLAQENKKTGDSLAVARANLARAAEVNEIQRRENEKRVNQIAQENAVLRERQAEAEAKATKLQAGFQSLRNSYDSLANEQKLTTNERAKYKALAEAAQMQADSEKIVIEHLRRDKDELDRTAQKIANLEVPELQTIYFDWQSYDLSSNARASLDKNLKILQDFPNITIQIVGSGDGVIWNRELEMEGTADDIAREDSVLGAKRARRAEEYLVGRGISTYRIRIIAYHGDYLGHSYHGQETHGRCEFVIIKQ